MEPSTLAGTALVVILGCYLLESFFFLIKDPLEPEYIRPRVPLIGHLLGINKYGNSLYYTKVGANLKAKVFALPIFNFKFYVIAERKFIASIQRNAKTISFTPFATKASRQFSGASENIIKMYDHLDGGPEAKEFDRVQRTALTAGPALDAMTLVATKVKLDSVDQLVKSATENSVETVDLFNWVKHVIGISSTEAMFGPLNPFRDSEHEADFWTFSKKVHLLLSGGLVANLFAKDAIQARDRNGKRYAEYVRRGGPEAASAVVRDRSRVLAENNISDRDIAHLNIGFDIAILSNYVPTTFWAIFEVLSRPSLVEKIRNEARNAVKTQDNGVYTLDISIIKSSCPLLLSSVQESQRLHSVHAHIREVTSDTPVSIDDTTRLLKKGNYVQLNGRPILLDRETWGTDAASFDPHRFIKMKRKPGSPGVASPGDLPPHALPVWGVAPHVCPARWFATSGIMVLIAMMVLKLDIEAAPEFKSDTTAERQWKIPQVDGLFVAVQSPAEPVPVVLRPRKEFEGEWNVAIGVPGTRLQLSVG